MHSASYFMLQVFGAKLPDFMAYQAHKGRVFLSPNTKLSDADKAAYLGSRELAERAAAALVPVVLKRHGERARIEILTGQSSGGGASAAARIDNKIKDDSAMMDARIAQRVFAPNKRPVMPV